MKLFPVSLVVQCLVDSWLAYHNSKLHSWFSMLVVFPSLTLIFELMLLTNFMKWLLDKHNNAKRGNVQRSITNFLIAQILIAFIYWIIICFSMHKLEPD